jgi:hypothetical protein
MDPPDERLRARGLLEILSAESDESDESDDQIEVDDGSAESNDTVAETPPPTLTLGDVLDSLPKAKNGKTGIKYIVHSIYLRNWTVYYFNFCNDSFVFAVNTPNINQLALPFKKRPVKSREQFLGLWTAGKNYVRNVSGAKGAYQANKELRRSEEFQWPVSPQIEAGLYQFNSPEIPPINPINPITFQKGPI